MDDRRINVLVAVLVGILTLFAGARFFGSDLFENNWSFTHWEYLPSWFGIGWTVLLALAFSWLVRFPQSLSRIVNGRWAAVAGTILLVIFVWTFRFDSILFGGGNLRIAQVAQSERIIYRWYEAGSLLLTSGFCHVFQMIGFKANDAGVFAWSSFAYLSTLLAIVAICKLSAELTSDRVRRIALFVLMFFGGHLMTNLGFTGPQVIVAPAVAWFMLFALKYDRSREKRSLWSIWGVTAIGTAFHISLLFLLPAALFVTFAGQKSLRSQRTALMAALVGFAAIVAGLIVVTGRSLEYSSCLLLLAGKNPLSDYSLFSPRHLSDFAQMLSLASPFILISFAFVFLRTKAEGNRAVIGAGWLTLFGGLTVALFIDPVASIVLDLPRLLAYTAPASFLLALYVSSLPDGSTRSGRFIALLVVAAIMVPLSFIPTYVWIRQSEDYVSAYLDEHDTYYGKACLAYRDAYFSRGEYSDADRWEWKIPIKSPDLLNLRGTVILAGNGENEEALKVLYQIIAKNPYWAEPRSVVAGIQRKLGRYKLAKPQIDTCLMLDPYTREHRINLYAYLRDIQNMPSALKEVTEAAELFPGDKEIQTDVMIISFRSGDHAKADSIAASLLARDSLLPFPYLIKGLIAERSSSFPEALRQMKRFVELAPNEPETPTIRQKIADLEGPTSNR